jgi:hypothetical protein
MRGFSDSIRRQLRDELRGIDAEVKGKVDFDSRQVAAEATEAVKAAQAAVPDIKGVKIDVDSDGLTRKVRLAAQIAEKTAPEIKLKAGIDEKRLTNFLGNLGGNPLRALGEAAEDLVKILAGGLTPAFGGVTQAGAQLVATALSLIAVTGALLAAFLALAVVIGGVLAVAIGSVVAGLAGIVVAIGTALPAAVLGAAPALASLAFIFEGFGKILTAITQGDLAKFDKALETLPTKTRALAEAFRPLVDLKDEVQELFFGTILEGFGGQLPGAISKFKGLVLDATETFGNFARDVIKNFSSIENKAKFDQIFQNVRPAIDSVLNALKPLSQAFLNVAAAGSKGFGKLGDAAATVLSKFSDVLNSIASDGTLDRILESFSQLVEVAGTELIGVFGDLAENAPAFMNVFTQMLPIFRPLIAAISEFLIAAGPGFVVFLQALAEAFSDPKFVQSMTDLGISLGFFLQQIAPLLVFLPTVISFFTGLAFAAGLLAGAFVFLLNTALSVVNFIKSVLFGNAISQFNLLSAAVNGLRAVLSALVGTARAAVAGVISAFNGLMVLKNIAEKAMADTRLALIHSVGQLVTIGKNLGNAVIEGFRSAISLASGIGRAIVQGLISGIRSMAKAAADAAIAVVKGAWESAKSFLKSHSPSKLMAELGEDFTLGFALGIPKPAFKVTAAVGELVSSAVAAATTAPMTVPMNFLSSLGLDDFTADLSAMHDEDRDKRVVLVADGVEIARIVNKKNKDLARR